MLSGLRAGMPVIHRHEPEVFPLILNTMPHIFTDVKVLSRPEVLLKLVFHISAMSSPHLDTTSL